jgi:hypothetical protein
LESKDIHAGMMQLITFSVCWGAAHPVFPKHFNLAAIGVKILGH